MSFTDIVSSPSPNQIDENEKLIDVATKTSELFKNDQKARADDAQEKTPLTAPGRLKKALLAWVNQRIEATQRQCNFALKYVLIWKLTFIA